jgi:hypothetical protein
MRVLFLGVVVVSACDPVAPPPVETHWYETCGTPVCMGYQGPTDGVPACNPDEIAGEACSDEGYSCDFQSDCGALLVCASEDPKTADGTTCPRSRARFKTDIAYLDASTRDAAARAALDTKLATWRYTWEDASSRPHLGFLIDDQEGSAAVARDGEHVDLYGYTSLAIAALQAQDARIAALEAELAAMRAELREQRAR